jgi:hypothetical protein
MTRMLFKSQRINHCFTESSLATGWRLIQELEDYAQRVFLC